MQEPAPTSLAGGFARRPEPRALGHAGRGRQILAGRFALAGQMLQGNPFETFGLPVAVLTELHGFGWLDDLAATGGADAREIARARVLDWLRDHPTPSEAVAEWLPEVAGRRLLRWLFHSGMILPGLDPDSTTMFFAAAGRHLSWLSDSWSTAPDGLPRLEALAALTIAALHLAGHDQLARLALVTLGEEAEAMGVETLAASRSAGALLDACSLLVWSAESARQSGMPVPAQLDEVTAQIARSLRGLRHADGSLPQFHGSGRGAPGLLDHCLAAAPFPATTVPGMPLGYARMARGRTTVVVDAAPPPEGEGAGSAHASTLGFEMVVARQPLVVSCGTGLGFGPVWAEAGRRTHNHSAVTVGGASCARFVSQVAGPDLLATGASRVWAGDYDVAGGLIAPDCGPAHSPLPAHLLAGHDGWLDSHGLTCLRELWLEPDGLTLDGEESLAALDPVAQELLDRVAPRGIGLDIRFHLHPSVRPEPEGDAVRLFLPGDVQWVFSHDGQAGLRIEPSRWLDPDLPDPVPTRQIVLTMLMTGRAIQLGWTFAQAEDR